jgi:hypothetical protein
MLLNSETYINFMHVIMHLKMNPIISREAHACMKYFVPQSTTQFANDEIIIFCLDTFEPCVI